MVYSKHLVFDNIFIVPIDHNNISGVKHGFHGMAVHPAGYQVGAFAGGSNVEEDIVFNMLLGNEHHQPGAVRSHSGCA